MELTASTLWWVLAGLLVVVELLTGTFYLLMLALGSAAGALAAHLGLGNAMQMVAAAMIGGGGTAIWHFRRASAPRSAPAASNRDVNIDIGQTVYVEAWGQNRLARVSYRGASWEVHHVGPADPAAGEHVIVAVQGNRLDVAPVGSR
jgi:membrane protein implicated in regulation of membrane protease activity